MARTAKARKTSHSSAKKTHKLRGKVIEGGERKGKVLEDAEREWEVEEIGPIYLMWSFKRTKTRRGKEIKQPVICKNEKHLIWIKWKEPYSDQKKCVWSAEPQNGLKRDGWGKEIQETLDNKIVWPFPDEKDPKLKEREKEFEKQKKEICLIGKFQKWKTTLIAEKNRKWELYNGAEPESFEADDISDDSDENDEVSLINFKLNRCLSETILTAKHAVTVHTLILKNSHNKNETTTESTTETSTTEMEEEEDEV